MKSVTILAPHGLKMPDVMTDKRKFDPARIAADQLRDTAAQGWPRYGVELAGQHQGWHAGDDGNERCRSELGPVFANAVQLHAI